MENSMIFFSNDTQKNKKYVDVDRMKTIKLG